MWASGCHVLVSIYLSLLLFQAYLKQACFKPCHVYFKWLFWIATTALSDNYRIKI